MTDLHNRIFNYRNAKPDDKEDSRKLIDDLFAEVERLREEVAHLASTPGGAATVAYEASVRKSCGKLIDERDEARASLVAEREWGDRVGHRGREMNGNIVVCPATFGGRCDCILSERPNST